MLPPFPGTPTPLVHSDDSIPEPTAVTAASAETGRWSLCPPPPCTLPLSDEAIESDSDSDVEVELGVAADATRIAATEAEEDDDVDDAATAEETAAAGSRMCCAKHSTSLLPFG